MRLGRVSCLLLVAAACASVDLETPRSESWVISDTASTHLGRQLAGPLAAATPGESGFLPLSNGIDALSARLQIAERAERTIDLQYYLIKAGITGSAVLESLLRAADRGVRVRFLLDDVFASGYDAGMTALDSHPNFEIRVFNPFMRGALGRLWSGVTDFSRINRRMHNKSFTVDDQITLIGGRNIADEYFGASKGAKFGDLDVAGIGPVVQDVSTMFDMYWNHETAIPVSAFADASLDPQAELLRLRKDLADSLDEARRSRYADAVRDTVLEFADMDSNSFVWAPYELVYDSPDKGVASSGGGAFSITTPLRDSLLAARREVLIVSPYFVPQESGVRELLELQQRGVQVTVITNSLAANNHAVVHGGYLPARKPLLEGGVRLYEVRADSRVAGSEHVARKDARSTLHTKAFIVDREEIFIGSFNFDPRSASLNTESGVIVRSPELASPLADRVDRALATQTYELFLNEKGKLRWRTTEGGEEIEFDRDPESTWFQRFTAGVARLLPIHDQL